MAYQLTDDERAGLEVLACRMVPFVERGMSFEEAMIAVRNRDAEIVEMVRSHSPKGNAVVRGIAGSVYCNVVAGEVRRKIAR